MVSQAEAWPMQICTSFPKIYVAALNFSKLLFVCQIMLTSRKCSSTMQAMNANDLA
jgi:hypothetical protein